MHKRHLTFFVTSLDWANIFHHSKGKVFKLKQRFRLDNLPANVNSRPLVFYSTLCRGARLVHARYQKMQYLDVHPNDYWTTLALNLFVWLSFQYFFYNFFYPDNKKFHLHFIAALKAGAFGIKCAKYCRLHYYNNKLWFCLVFLVLTIGESLLRFLLICLLHRKHC